MNYTETVRNYLKNKLGEVFDAGYEQNHSFNMIEIKTFSKILNRLEEEGLITKISKGVYFINDGSECNEEKIVNYYTGEDNYNGILIGDSLLYKLGLVSTKPVVTELISQKALINRNIGNIRINKVKHYSCTSIETIIMLEIMENLKEPFDQSKYVMIMMKNAEMYSDLWFECAIQTRKYKYSTIQSLSQMLTNMGKDNKMIEIFERVDS